MVKRQPLPTQARLLEMFSYDPETGVVTAKEARETHRGAYAVGDVIGRSDAYGYLKVYVDGFPYLLHRLIWKMVTGEEPPAFIDHRDRNKQNNRWENLRAADSRTNTANTGLSRLNTSGAKGVTFATGVRKWSASIGGTFLGLFASRDEAAAAYETAARERFGDFSCTDIGPQKVFYEVVEMIDEEFCAAMANAALRLWATRVDSLEAIGDSISRQLVRVAPHKYGHLRVGP